MEEREMVSGWISTGIRELDSLLGKGPLLPRSEGGIQQGSVVLIRGEPGSGKTTLGLQLLSHYLSTPDNKAVLFALEEDPTRLLERMDDYFDFHLKEVAKKRLYYIDAKTIIREIEERMRTLPQETGGALKDGLQGGKVLSTVGLPVLEVLKHLRRTVKLPRKWQRLLNKGGLLILIDSLDAFMSALRQAVSIDEPRVLLKGICDVLRSGITESGARGSKRPNTILLTSEYHYHSPTPTPAFTDSFYCDVEILLRPEPLCVPEDYEQHIQAPVGYSLNTLIRAEAKSIESRSFCRVLKSRASPNQSRRCAYDIVPSKGVQFFETYPGDGKLVLFAENEPQRLAWASFFRHDVPDSYPALRHEVFDRMSLQTVYEGQRRLTNIPLKTDMYLASFDSYWIGWYRSLKFKCDLHNALEPLLKPMQAQRVEYSRFVNSLSRAFRVALPDIRGASTNAVQRAIDAGTVGAAMAQVADLSKFAGFLTAYTARTEKGPYSASSTGSSQELKVGQIVLDLLQMPTPFARDYSCFLQRLPFRALRLFGEKRSGILPEIVEAMTAFRGHEWVKDAKDFGNEQRGAKKALDTEWLSVPYDANIGLFVYRKDILRGSRNKLNREKVRARLMGLVEREQTLMGKLYESLPGLEEMKYDDGRKGPAVGATVMDELKCKLPYCSNPDGPAAVRYNECVKKVVDWAADRIQEGDEPRTWEEVIVQCEMLDKRLLIETQTFDSYMCTLLEMLWNSGGELKVRPDYTVEEKHKLFIPLLRALHLLDTLFDSRIVDRNSTVSAPLRASRNLARDDDWLFARHWYSTLIDCLTSVNAAGEYHATFPSEASLEIMPVPVSLALWADRLYELEDEVLQKSLLDCPKSYQFILQCVAPLPESGIVGEGRQCPLFSRDRSCAKKGVDDLLRSGPRHHSCWGDWSFGLLSGSENLTLAVDLINNMMGSIKVISRAFAGACLPTVTEFYEMFADVPCIYLPERTDIGLPSFTYHDLRTKIFSNARTRSDVYDYMNCAKILTGQVEFLRRTKDPKEEERNEGLIKRCLRIINEIEGLYNELILIPFGDVYQAP